MSPFQPTVHNLLKHKRLTTFSADRHIYASFCAQYKYDLNIKHRGPHTLRHSCATHLVNSGHSMKEVADLLGHQMLDTTRIYAKVDMVGLRKVADMEWEGLL